MKPIIKIIFLFFFPLLTALCTFLILNSLFLTSYDKSKQDLQNIIVTDNLKQTALTLENEKIIKNWWSFYVISKLRSLKNNIITGEYEFSPSMTPLEIVKKVNKGLVKIRELKINPGDTIQQVIDKISLSTSHSKQEVEEKIFNRDFINSLGIPNGNPEGYLFPASYKFSLPITIDDLLIKILNEGKKHWIPAFDEQAKFLKMDKKQIIILASIIEKECSTLGIYNDLQTLRNISAAYHNRLKKGLPLNAVSTIYHINPRASHPLTSEDKKQFSPFNTFINIGLPPSPICNPSNNTIKATLYPSGEKYTTFSFDNKTRSVIFGNE